MNKEKIKSLLLVGLVLLSGYLVQQLLSDVPFSLLPSIGAGMVETIEYNISDIISPEKYLVNFSEKNRTMIYSDKDYRLWGEAKDTLKQVLQDDELSIDKISSEEFIDVNKQRSINFYFSEDAYTYMVGKTLDIEIPNQIYDKMIKFDSIHFDLGDKPFIIISNDSYHLKVTFQNGSFNNLKEIVKKIEGDNYTKYYTLTEVLPGIENNTYVPLSMAQGLPKISVRNEINIEDDKQVEEIAKLFFDRNIDYIRKIEENDGSIIYIDNLKNLKIYKNGAIEYFSAIKSQANNRNFYLSLSKSIDFISKHMGLPEDAYLAEVKEIEFENNKGYRFVFRYRIEGLTVISAEIGSYGFIEIDIFNEQVKSYKRHVLIADELNYGNQMHYDILSGYDIIEKNFVYLKDRYIIDNNLQMEEIDRENIDNMVKASIRNIYLAYYDDFKTEENVLNPVWIINISGNRYAFDAYGGYEKNGGSIR